MFTPTLLPCDGCGQIADSAHISRRLQRLEWATRFRPVHIHTLLLNGIAPEQDSDFLYGPAHSFQGGAGLILKAAQLSTEGKSPETVLTEFQKLGLMLTHILECPLENNTPVERRHELLEKQLPFALARIRRSLKPKGVVLLVTAELEDLAIDAPPGTLPCPVFRVSWSKPLPREADFQAFRTALAAINT